MGRISLSTVMADIDSSKKAQQAEADKAISGLSEEDQKAQKGAVTMQKYQAQMQADQMINTVLTNKTKNDGDKATKVADNIR